ncbi:hypothetical protein HMPREF0367_01076 [[Eubacterium] cylindroides ATCC 27803]|uniref:Helix-turn-helix domain-containing protein n=2 Tax=Faecalitalea cylindroides TaxID=39483 RepID=U2PN73_9FIRM|nr:hypothetical protein HMPREF0367_01076 [[Eubacterium] cylindroides ATCC 27803] [Faecalitalea cylindroides ATCC 27803]
MINMDIEKEVENVNDVRTCNYNSLAMLSREEVAKLCLCHKDMVSMWIGLGMLQATKTSRGYAISQKELERFQEAYKGQDISNPVHAKEAFINMNKR